MLSRERTRTSRSTGWRWMSTDYMETALPDVFTPKTRVAMEKYAQEWNVVAKEVLKHYPGARET
jgi:hypothetical protein